MLEKDREVKWTAGSKLYFEKINQALTEAPMLVTPYFSKYFLTFSFSYEDTIVAVLMQKNSEGLNNLFHSLVKT